MVVSWGLAAGLSLSETHRMKPGQVIDLFIYRQKYSGGIRLA